MLSWNGFCSNCDGNGKGKFNGYRETIGGDVHTVMAMEDKNIYLVCRWSVNEPCERMAPNLKMFVVYQEKNQK